MNTLALRSLALVLVFAPPGRGQPAPPADPDALPAGAVARLGSATPLYESDLQGLSLSPDGSQVFVAGDKHIRLHDAATGRVLREFVGIESSVVHAALSPDGKLVAAGENGSRVWLWDAATGRELHRLEGAGTSVVCWSADSKWVATGTTGKVMVWDAATGKPLQTCAASASALAFSPDGKRLVSGDFENDYRVWDTATGKGLLTLKGRARGARRVTFSPDGKSVVGYAEVGSGGISHARLWHWDAETGKPTELDAGWFGPAEFLPGGKEFVTAHDNKLIFWDAATRKQVRTWAPAGNKPCGVGLLTLSGDGKWLAGVVGGHVRMWDAATGKERGPRAGHVLPVTAVAFAPDGRTVASGSADQTIRVWDWAGGRELGKYACETQSGVTALAYTPDGKQIVSLDEGGTPGRSDAYWRVSDATTGRLVREFRGKKFQTFTDFALDPTGKRVLTVGYDSGIGEWDVGTGKEMRRIDVRPPDPRGSTPRVLSVSPSPDGRYAAWAIIQSTEAAGVVDLVTGKPVVEFRLPPKPEEPGGPVFERVFEPQHVAFSPDGRCVATSARSARGGVCLWHPSTGELLAEWDVEAGGRLAFTPNGRLLATATDPADASEAPEVAVWDVLARKELVRFRGHRSKVTALAFEPRGRVLVSASADGTLLVWDLTGGLKGAKLPARDLSAVQLAAAWDALKGDDPKRAQAAVVALASAAPAVAFLAERLEPATVAGEKWELTPEQVQAVRGVAALEYAGTADARKLLRRLVDGEPKAHLTRQAKAVLDRLRAADGAK